MWVSGLSLFWSMSMRTKVSNGHCGCTHSMHEVMCLHAPGWVEAQLKSKLCVGLEIWMMWCICIQWIRSWKNQIQHQIKVTFLIFWWEIFTYITPLTVSFPPHLFSYLLERRIIYTIFSSFFLFARKSVWLWASHKFPNIPTIFRKVHINTMLMPTINKFCYLVQAHCALSSWPEWCCHDSFPMLSPIPLSIPWHHKITVPTSFRTHRLNQSQSNCTRPDPLGLLPSHLRFNPKL